MIYVISDLDYYMSFPMPKYNLEDIIQHILNTIRFDSDYLSCRRNLNAYYFSLLLGSEEGDAIGFGNWGALVEYEGVDEISAMFYILNSILKVDISIYCPYEELDSFLIWMDSQAQNQSQFWSMLIKDINMI